MNGIRLCTCGHQDRDHIYHDGPCRPGFVCPAACTKFVLAGGSTTPGPSITEQERREAAAQVLDQMLADALDDVTADRVERLRAGTWTSADLTPESRHVAREIDLAAQRRTAVLHPIAQTAAAEHVDVSRSACYGCGHSWEHHQEGSFGGGLACRAWDETGPSGTVCRCPVYVETPPVDACGRCGHSHALHRTSGRCLGTGVDIDGNERARSCACGMYLPEQPPEIEPVDRLCLCGHPESEHAPFDAPALARYRKACKVKADGEYVDSCIEFRPATITEVLPNGVVLEHTPSADKDHR